MVALPTKGPAGYAAVSVDSDGDGIGVAELIKGASGTGGSVVPSSPCTLGAAPAGYVPTGSTAGSSDVRLSLYDPDATPAVVDVSVSNGTGLSSPPAFQGVVVPAEGLVVLDLRRWVFQLGSMAVTASAVSGDVVVGALETTSTTMAIPSGSTTSHKAVRVHFTGSSLLVGPDRGLPQWDFTALQSRIGVSSMFSVYDPGRRPVLVSVAPPGRAGLVAALTENVPAGGIVDFATPIVPGTRLGAKSVVVLAGRGATVIVARLTTRQRSPVLEELNSTSGTAGASEQWLLPGATVSAKIDDVVTLVDPGGKSASVILRELTYGPVAARLAQVSVLAGTQAKVDLRRVVGHPATFALEISASAPVLVEQQLKPSRGQITAVGGIPISS